MQLDLQRRMHLHEIVPKGSSSEVFEKKKKWLLRDQQSLNWNIRSKLLLYNISFNFLTAVLAILEKYDRVESGGRDATEKRRYELRANGTFNPDSFNFSAKSSSVFCPGCVLLGKKFTSIWDHECWLGYQRRVINIVLIIIQRDIEWLPIKLWISTLRDNGSLNANSRRDLINIKL